MATAFGVAANNAELVTFRVGENHPTSAIGVAPIGYLPRAESNDTRDFVVPETIGRCEIEMDPVLDRLAVGDLDDNNR